MGIQLDKSKVNFFEKMIWRIQYRDLYKNFGNNILAMKVLLHDKEGRNFYNKNKSEINFLLNSSEENFSEYKNEIFESWSKKYFVHELTSNYISYNDNSIKNNSKEVFVTNYDKGNDE